MTEQKELARLLKDEIEELLATLYGAADLSDLSREALSKKRRGLNPDAGNDKPWPLLPLIVSEAICNECNRALPAAAAIQFLLAAGDVFDDIEDADSPDSIFAKHGLAVAISVATTLLILGERSLARLKLRGVHTDTVVHILDMVNSFYTKACTGQHIDLIEGTHLSGSEDEYLKIIAMKSGAQVECSCYIGALIAGAHKKLIDSFALFGRNLGIAAQISNDIQGIITGRDIIKRKMTLPMRYAINLPDRQISDKLIHVFGKGSNNLDAIKEILFNSGAIHYATLTMDIYKQKASDTLSIIQSNGTNVEKLKLLLL